ncbi:futalosine hydrolase [Desulfovibrio sp. OttesenSCG-928-G15]|nr:futalosine hydrolase [Desulfovibrio sp. OttesenSCG-928-G15]
MSVSPPSAATWAGRAAAADDATTVTATAAADTAAGGGAVAGDKSAQILLVAATAQEMAAAIRKLPGAQDIDLSHANQGALLAVQDTVPPVLPLPVRTLPATGGIPAPSGLRLLVCGVGPLAAALTTAGEIALSRQAGSTRPPLRGIVHVGLAGSYKHELAPVGSLLLADSECFPEYGAWPEYDEVLGGEPGSPSPLSFAQGVLPGAKAIFGHIGLEPERELGIMGLTCHSSWRRGALATVSAVSGTPRRAMRMAGESGALAEAMEGFAVALCARAWGLPFAELRAVSNIAGHRPPDTWNFTAAADALADGLARLCGMHV